MASYEMRREIGTNVEVVAKIEAPTLAAAFDILYAEIPNTAKHWAPIDWRVYEQLQEPRFYSDGVGYSVSVNHEVLPCRVCGVWEAATCEACHGTGQGQ